MITRELSENIKICFNLFNSRLLNKDKAVSFDMFFSVICFVARNRFVATGVLVMLP